MASGDLLVAQKSPINEKSQKKVFTHAKIADLVGFWRDISRKNVTLDTGRHGFPVFSTFFSI